MGSMKPLYFNPLGGPGQSLQIKYVVTGSLPKVEGISDRCTELFTRSEHELACMREEELRHLYHVVIFAYVSRIQVQ